MMNDSADAVKHISRNYYFVSCIEHLHLNAVIASNDKKCVSIFWITLYYVYLLSTSTRKNAGMNLVRYFEA